LSPTYRPSASNANRWVIGTFASYENQKFGISEYCMLNQEWANKAKNVLQLFLSFSIVGYITSIISYAFGSSHFFPNNISISVFRVIIFSVGFSFAIILGEIPNFYCDRVVRGLIVGIFFALPTEFGSLAFIWYFTLSIILSALAALVIDLPQFNLKRTLLFIVAGANLIIYYFMFQSYFQPQFTISETDAIIILVSEIVWRAVFISLGNGLISRHSIAK